MNIDHNSSSKHTRTNLHGTTQLLDARQMEARCERCISVEVLQLLQHHGDLDDAAGDGDAFLEVFGLNMRMRRTRR